ncbi:hypothetical protein FRC04_007395 [Tulasnella sp. 424]|nr:hypothetical protein FRC04_007395 [Tulasnella sp. 424]KAG8966462.1 hypothetical protein FRC05_002654 [Tulasnella sp. 425]
MNVGLPYSNPAPHPWADFDDAVSSISDEFDSYIDSLQTNAGFRDSVDDASRVPRFSAVPAVRVLPLVPTDVSPSTGALAAPLPGASIPSSALASVRVSSKSGEALRTKVKPLKSLPRSFKSANSSPTTWGSLTVRVDPSGTVKRHDLPLDLLTEESLRTLLIAHNVDRHNINRHVIIQCHCLRPR